MASGSRTAWSGGDGDDGERPRGGHDEIFQRLAAEHDEVAALIERVGGTIEIRVRQELFPEIRRILLAHARAEEEAFYPVLRELPGLAALTARCLEDHAEVVRHLDRLDVKDKATKRWGELFEEMMRAVARHVIREEHELFPRARELLGVEQAHEMGIHYAASVHAGEPKS